MNPPNPPNPPNTRNPPSRQIRGPQSALTDFLASHNINANQIRQDADARRAAARASLQQTEDSNDANTAELESAPAKKRKNETKAQTLKRQKEEQKAIAKIKASKQFQRSRRRYGSDDEITDEDEAARAFFEENMAPLPGQMENCEICDKRFLVTGYSRAGPDGGLLCSDCSKELDKEEGVARKKRKVLQGEKRQQRRKIQSQLLDGIYPGAKDLVTLCVESLAHNVNLADDFGDLPATLINRLSSILSKKRLIDSRTLDLFLRSGYDTVKVYDGAKLSSDDYIRIFQIVPTLKHLKLRNAVRFKNHVMEHLLGTTVKLETLDIHGANLLDNERWDRFLSEKGSDLKVLKVHWTDGYFGDDQVEMTAKYSPDLERFKVSHNQKVTDVGIRHIAEMKRLVHLGIEIYIPQGGKHLTSDPIIHVLNSIGHGLRTFSLENIGEVDDTVLAAIHENCQNLSKLRMSDNHVMTDPGFSGLFAGWLNPPLTYVDFGKCRHIDSTDPRENPDAIGFGEGGLKALMEHSGLVLKHLDIHSCRHIPTEAFEHIFAMGKSYPALEWMDISFCQGVNDFVVGCIYRSCPNLKILKVFGNFGVKEVKIPKGRILIGMPNALGMQIEGTEDGEGKAI